MRTEEKIGQLCMFGFSGTTEISAEFREIMNDYHIGNVILYGEKNTTRSGGDGGFRKCKRLTDSIREASGSEIPLLISTDVEGGNVTRFHWSKTLLSAQSLGKSRSTEKARAQFERIAEGLKSAGINVDLAPCLDIAKAPSETFLKKRIISSDRDVASRIGVAVSENPHHLVRRCGRLRDRRGMHRRTARRRMPVRGQAFSGTRGDERRFARVHAGGSEIARRAEQL